MKLALFDDFRLGVVLDDSVIDVTSALPAHETDLGAPFWLRLCRDYGRLRHAIGDAAREGRRHDLSAVTLRAPVLNPTKIVAAASNYGDHVDEMKSGNAGWMLDFDVFLKAPSSIADPASIIRLPDVDDEVHYEGELAVVIGQAGRDIAPDAALDHVVGYTILVDMTVRGKGDRSRRKSYDGFTPIGPWMVTAEDIDDWRDLHIQLWLNGELRQDVLAGAMLRSLPEVISYASTVMTLHPGDVISTGAPAGVGRVVPGDHVEVAISELGTLEFRVVNEAEEAGLRGPTEHTRKLGAT
jgi:2-keto-4-pentenoate hydratase/2-oxohepta-3-ene-1,7-dioic acid hydratase in catechol pathway